MPAHTDLLFGANWARFLERLDDTRIAEAERSLGAMLGTSNLPEQIFDFVHSRGFTLTRLMTCAGGHGCNQYVFRRDATESGGA